MAMRAPQLCLCMSALGVAACATDAAPYTVESRTWSETGSVHVLRIGDELRRVEQLELTTSRVVLVQEDARTLAVAVELDDDVVYFDATGRPGHEVWPAVDDATEAALAAAVLGELDVDPPTSVLRMRPGWNPFACSYQRDACRYTGGWACDVEYYDCMSGR